MLDVKTPEQYVNQLSGDRKVAIGNLRKTILENLPVGFEETVNYKMIGYIVPHSINAEGYHCDSKQALPFINLASQKNFIALYHMGIYAKPELLNWFVNEYSKHCNAKLDMGKSCIRFKKMDQIPFDLLGELCSKMTTEEWIDIYEKTVKR